MKARAILALVLIGLGSTLVAALAAGPGPNFDFLKDEDRKVLQDRFTKEIYPLMQRHEKNGCVGCHHQSGKINSSLKMTGNADKDFRMLVKDGFFIPNDTGSMLTRVTSKDRKKKMPPPGKADPWTKEEVELLTKFVSDLDSKQQKKTK